MEETQRNKRKTNKQGVAGSLLFLLLQFGTEQFILHHLAVLECLHILMAVHLLPQLDLPIQVVFELLNHELPDALLVEGVAGLAVEPAHLLRRVAPLLLPPVVPVVGLRSVEDMRLSAGVLEGLPGRRFFGVVTVRGGQLSLLADCRRTVLLDTDFVSLMKVSRVDCPRQSHFSPVHQLEQPIVFLPHRVIFGKAHLLGAGLAVSHLHPDGPEVCLVHGQQIFQIFDFGDDFPKDGERAVACDGIFCESGDFLGQGRRGILEVFKGYGPEDGFEGRHALPPHLEAVALHRKLLRQPPTLVRVASTHQQVGHISNIFQQKTYPLRPPPLLARNLAKGNRKNIYQSRKIKR